MRASTSDVKIGDVVVLKICVSALAAAAAVTAEASVIAREFKDIRYMYTMQN